MACFQGHLDLVMTDSRKLYCWWPGDPSVACVVVADALALYLQPDILTVSRELLLLRSISANQLHYNMAHSRFAPSQWETALLCKDVSHWLGANLESVLLQWCHMSIKVSQITDNLTVSSNACWVDKSKESIIVLHYWTFVRGIHQWSVVPLSNGQWCGKYDNFSIMPNLWCSQWWKIHDDLSIWVIWRYGKCFYLVGMLQNPGEVLHSEMFFFNARYIKRHHTVLSAFCVASVSFTIHSIPVTSCEHHGVSNHQQHNCWFNSLFRLTTEKTSRLSIAGLLWGESSGPVDSPLTKDQ